MATEQSPLSGGKAPSRRPWICAIVFLSLACIGLLIGVIVLATRKTGKDDVEELDEPLPTSTDPELSLGLYRNAAVTCDNAQCSEIGADILALGGSAVDAAIAGLLCLGVASPHYVGIGGGFLMTIYAQSKQDTGTTKTVRTLNAREVAPIAATEDMYINSSLSSVEGGGAIAVPGNVAGMKAAHDLYGRLPWAKLFERSIALAKRSRVSGSLAKYSRTNEPFLHKHQGLREVFLKDNRTYEEGEVIRLEKLARTMQVLADQGAEAFYDGALSSEIIQDITDEGGIITLEDLKKYAVVWKDAVEAKILNNTVTVYGPPPPSSAIVIAFILNIIEGYHMDKKTPADLSLHRFAEAMKFAFAKRSLLGDADFAANITQWIDTLTSADFASETRAKIDDDKTFQDFRYYGPAFDIQTDAGTAQLSVVAADGSAVSVTSTINLHFGAKVLGARTGIIFNCDMDDFSTPGQSNVFGVPSSPQNYIVPGKRPMSSMSPLIAVDDAGRVRANLGAAGGTRIITAVAQAIMNSMLYGMPIDKAVAAPRIHHQLIPPELMVEKNLPKSVREGLEARGHKVEEGPMHRWFGATMAIIRRCDDDAEEGDGEEADMPCLQATSDWRAEEDARKAPLTAGYLNIRKKEEE